jgi:hypothetical protein
MVNAEHKTALGRLIQWLGSTIGKLFNSTGKAFKELPPDQQQGAIFGSQISQIIKNGYAKGEAWVISEISNVTGLPSDVVEQTVLSIAKDAGVNTASVQVYLDHLADKLQSGITDNGHDALFETIAKFAASYLTQGKLNWVTLGLGIIEYVYNAYIKK